jgi:SNF2 family DNA or RNA helicase
MMSSFLTADFALPLQTFSQPLSLEPGGVVSVPIPEARIKTLGCQFTLDGAIPAAAARGKARPGPVGAGPPAPLAPLHASRHTRIRPPRDVVKISDRLRMLLEPPLEALLAARALGFAHPPFPYQLDGVAFLFPRQRAVLADEMGLGKTMQAITAVRLLVHQRQVRRVLLVCPKPLVTNWQREFALWGPELPVTLVEGGPIRRRWLWRESLGPITITNYETIVRDRDELGCAENQFDLVILDEAQRIKNTGGATNEAIRSIARSRSWALTGTPLENSVEDLVGLFQFVAPGLVDRAMRPRAVSRTVSDLVLRRTKEQVLADLPGKLVRDALVDLSDEQAAAYQLAEVDGLVRLREMKQAITIRHVFELVLRLKQICNFDPATGASSKLERLEADLDECAASGRKALVFSQWVETLNELRSRLARFAPAEYHGRIPYRRRDAQIARFRDDPRCHVMLMTYGAGSVGLNLQFAGYVFLFDRWWNPAVEDQAIHRAHRIGVRHPVTVTRFVCSGTIEQRIDEILSRKRALFDEVFGGETAAPSCGLTRDELFSLFDLKQAA